MDSRITKSLGADYEAVKNDLEQAKEFAEELQNEVAVSKNGMAHFKQLFEKTRQDLERMHDSILALRQERHRFANEVMKARCWEEKVGMLTKERDELLNTLAKAKRGGEQRDAQIAELTMQIMLVKNTLRQTQEVRAAEVASQRFEPVKIELFMP